MIQAQISRVHVYIFHTNCFNVTLWHLRFSWTYEQRTIHILKGVAVYNETHKEYK